MTSDPQDLVNLIHRIVKNKSVYAVNEQRTKNGVVHPLLACLGWDPFNMAEVDPEYAVGSGRVDYCLKRGDVAAAFIEVKRVDEPLVKHQEQLLRYAFDKSVTLAALTDGIRWWLYLPTQPNSSWEQRRFFTIDLGQQEPQDTAAHFRKYLGKSEVHSGSALRAAQEIQASHAKQRAIREAIPIAWRELCEGPDSLLVELLSEKVEGHCGHKPDPEDLGEFIVGRSRPPDPCTRPSQTHQQAKRVLPVNRATNPRDDGEWTHHKPTSFTFLDTQHPVSTFKEVLISLVAILYEMNPDQFWPTVQRLGSSRRYFARESEGLRSLRTPRRIADSDISMETNFSAESIRERLHELLVAFGHPEDGLSVELR